MVNAWSLLASILDGTFEEDYPVMNKKEIEHSDAWYDYKRNDPNRENPFTDPVDRERAESSAAYFPSASQAASAQSDLYGYEPDGLDYENSLYESSSGDDYMADVDDQRAHHFKTYDDGMSLQVTEETKMDQDFYEPKRAHFYKYHEEDILKDIEEYVSLTYQGHYTGKSHEYRNVQTIDLMASKELAASFCQANILKYGSRYGNKDGKNKKDLLKVIHYAMLLLHFDGHYGKPSMPSGNFDQMP